MYYQIDIGKVTTIKMLSTIMMTTFDDYYDDDDDCDGENEDDGN